jgi:hypothetical protein
VGIIESALLPLGDHLWCELCRGGLKERVDGLVKDWKGVKVSLLLLFLLFSSTISVPHLSLESSEVGLAVV